MNPPKRIGERMVALFLFGVLVFNPPILTVFDVGGETTLMGIPLLFFFIFASWGGLILLLAIVVRSHDPAETFDRQKSLLDEPD